MLSLLFSLAFTTHSTLYSSRKLFIKLLKKLKELIKLKKLQLINGNFYAFSIDISYAYLFTALFQLFFLLKSHSNSS